MKLIHTSDWHLGATFHGIDLLDAQAAFLDQLVDVVECAGVDCVLVSGDVFDRSVPPVAALRAYETAMGRLAARAPVVVISGNHDSPDRLGFGGSLLRPELSVRTHLRDIARPVELADEYGPVLIYPVPYLDPDHARRALAEGEVPLSRSHEAVLGAAVGRIDADVRRRATASDGVTTRSVALAHCFVTGGRSSDSERAIEVGGVGCVPATIFSSFDYTALGHLHRAQDASPNGECVVGYSGSPLRFSFSEADDDKGFALVTLGRQGVNQIDHIPVVQPREMARLRGTLDELIARDVAHRHKDEWVQVTITDEDRPDRFNEKIKAAFPHALVIRHEPGGPAGESIDLTDTARRNPLQVVVDFVHEMAHREATVEERRLLDEVIRAVQSEPEAEVER